MNVNADKGELIRLHRLYNHCIQERLSNFLKDEPTSEQSSEVEWCAAEKQSYLNHMRTKLPNEYNNIMRLEQNNFWHNITQIIRAWLDNSYLIDYLNL